MAGDISRRSFLGASAAAAALLARPASASPGAEPFFSKIGKPIGVQLYALGDAAQSDLFGTLSRLKAMGFGDFELPGLYGREAGALRADADRAGARYSSLHLGLPAPGRAAALNLQSPAADIAKAADALGLKRIVNPFPMLPADLKLDPARDFAAQIAEAIHAQGPDMWKRLAGLMNERAAALKPYGLSLSYHNHNMEFLPQAGSTGWRILNTELEPGLVTLELDLGWIAAAGLDPAEEILRQKGRVVMVHLKDIKASTKTNFALQQDPVEVGSGVLDWAKILPACADAGVEHYFVEQEPPYVRDRFESMSMACTFLKTFRA